MRALLRATNLQAAACAAARQSRAAHLGSRRLIVAQGEGQQGEASTSQPAAAAPPAAAPAPTVRVPPQTAARRMPPPPPSPYGENVEVKRVEQRGDSRFSGVVALDRGETPDDLGRVALLVAGDAAALLLFASIGRLSHGEGWSLLGALGTAWPFMAGWYGVAAATGAYGKAAQGGNTGTAAGAAAKAWALGIPAGLLLRSATRGYLPEPTFMAISMAVNGLFLVGWRAALAAATEAAPEPQSRAEQLRSRGNRKGNVLEMFSMLTSLVKRW